MQNVASGDVRCLISICRTGQFLLHVLSKLCDMARKKKPFTKQPTSNWNYMFIPTIVLKKNINRAISVILLLVNDKDPPPSTFTYLVRKPLFGPNSGHYTPSQMSTRRIFTGFEQKESIWKNLINWPLNRPFSHLIFVTFSLNGTLSHVSVMAVT